MTGVGMIWKQSDIAGRSGILHTCFDMLYSSNRITTNDRANN